MRERLKRILCLILSLTAAAGLMLVRDSAAWFDMQSGSPIGQSISIDKMNFVFTGDLNSVFKLSGSSFMVTDENLIATIDSTNHRVTADSISCTNYSSIPTEMRFQITYKNPLNGNDATFEPAAANIDRDTETGVTTATNAALEMRCPNAWVYDSSSSYFVYSGGETGSEHIIPAIVNNTPVPYTIMTYLAFSEAALSSSTYSNLYTNTQTGTKQSAVTVTVQARQSDNMIWQDVGVLSLAST